MKTSRTTFLLVVMCGLVAFAIPVQAKCQHARSQTAKRQFAKLHPCPATGLPVSSCKGYVIDHIKPLCAKGKDVPSNMQWQLLADAKAKDTEERKLCRSLKK